MVSDWRPTATWEVLKSRAEAIRRARAYLDSRGLIEVQVPVLSTSATTEPVLSSFRLDATPGGPARFLATSPEFPSKRLLAAGAGDLYVLAGAFREGEEGRGHNPEFTLLEWYRVGWNYLDLADEVIDLIAYVFGPERSLPASRRTSFRRAFELHAGIDPFLATDDELREALAGARADAPADIDRDGLLDLLMATVVAPRLGQEGPEVIYDFPAAQAALARVRDEQPPVAERFEVFLRGSELSNGFQELTDPEEQRRRFDEENLTRVRTGAAAMPVDERLLAAMAHGLPDCSGVALGIDRLVMLANGLARIEDVLAFPWDRA